MSALPLSVLALVMAVGVGALAPTTRILSAQHPAAASLLGRQVPGARFARGPVACAAPPAATRKVVVTDMDETLISKKSTGYVITFLLKSRSFRILLVPFLAAVLIPVSKFSRTFAVRVMYWFAFRGMRVDRAKRVAEEFLAPKYAADLQDPAASAVLAADDAIVITASPDFMARPWLEQYLKVAPARVYGAVLEESRRGRFTGRTLQIPIGQAKAEILRKDPVANAPGTTTVGYGDHPTDVPLLRACSRGILVHPLQPIPDGIEYIAASKFSGKLERS